MRDADGSRAPCVSVILPVFDRLKFLPAAIDSVFAQTFEDWELLIADDGSGPQTRDYLETIGSRPRVRLLRLAHCGNPGIVRNAALRVARGEYVAFLDSDDVWVSDKLSRQLASLRIRPDRRWSHTAFDVIDGEGELLKGVRARSAAEGSILEDLITLRAVIALPSVMVERQLLLSIGAFDGSLRMCEDYDLWLRLARHSPIDAIHARLLHVRRHSEHSGDDASAFEGRRQALEKLLGSAMEASMERLVREERAKVAAGLARSHATYGSRWAAFSTLARSVGYSCRYASWWRGMGAAFLTICIPRRWLPALRRLRRKTAQTAVQNA